MKSHFRNLFAMFLGLLVSTSVQASDAQANSNAAVEHADNHQGGPHGFGGPIVLNPDDKLAFPNSPTGFDVKRDGIPRGQLEMVA